MEKKSVDRYTIIKFPARKLREYMKERKLKKLESDALQRDITYLVGSICSDINKMAEMVRDVAILDPEDERTAREIVKFNKKLQKFERKWL